MQLDTDVVIVGAGISGLKAAADLNANGVKSIILEARDRLGGRIFTNRALEDDGFYDMGATWFHSTMENPLFNKTIDEWFSKDAVRYDDYNLKFVMDTEDGNFPSGCGAINSIVDEIKYFASNSEGDSSLQNTLIDYLKTKEGLLTETETKYASAVYKFAELMNGCNWDMISSKLAYGPFTGRDAFNLLGYDKLLEKIVEKYDSQNIKLNHVVKSIEKVVAGKADETVVKVTVASGEIFTCKYVIVTVPLGVLKLSINNLDSEGAIKFTPELPKHITDKMDKTSYTNLGKVIVEFDDSFWPENDKFLVLSIPKDAELAEKLPTREFGNFEEDVEAAAFDFPCLVTNYKVVRNKPALMFLLPTQPANQIENASDPEAYAYKLIKPIISKISGKPAEELPVPKLILTTKWGSDPFSRGAISANSPGDHLVNDELVGGFGNIRFAGEDTVYQGHCCAHGAYMSGEREAAWILERIGKSN